MKKEIIPEKCPNFMSCKRSETLPQAKKVIANGNGKIHLKVVLKTVCSNEEVAKKCPIRAKEQEAASRLMFLASN